MPDEIIIVGGGASGLMAAREVSAAGKLVRIIEARPRAGGRINTISSPDFSMRIEAGAEFVHGNLPLTLGLLKEAGISYHAVEGDLWNARHAKPHKQEDFIEDQKILIKKLRDLEQDTSVQQFLDEHFNDEKYEDLRSSIMGYVQGYDLADTELASAFALREEWLNNEDEEQYRIDGGYGALVNYLKQQCEANGCLFDFDTTIKLIDWKKNEVRLHSAEHKIFTGVKAIITVPLSILQTSSVNKASIEFTPPIPSKLEAISNMGYGQIIKFIIEFNEAFWENKNVVGENRMKQLGFVFADTIIPTWWTQAPATNPILTGWFGGPGVRKWKDLNDESLLQLATDSLAGIFNIDHAVLIEKIIASRVFNWTNDDYSLGGYAYASLNRDKYLEELLQPEENTLYFSGEALEKKKTTLGTVEAALACGARTALSVLESFK